MCVRPFVAFRDDGVTFDGKMGKLFIKYSAFCPHPWVVCEMPTHQLICPTPSGVELCWQLRKCSRVLFCLVWEGGGYPGLLSGIAFEFSGDYA